MQVDMFITQMIMRDVNNGWLIRYTHGAPCDGLIEQTDFVEKIICLLLIIPWNLISPLGSEQSKELLTSAVGPGRSFNGGALYGKDNKLDTSNWSQYPLAVLSRICRLPSTLLLLVRGIRKVLFKVDSIHI